MKLANKKEETKVTQAAIKKVVENAELSKSKKMIALFEYGLEVKEIASLLDVRYNFVYNVVSNYTKVNNVEVVTSKREGVKEKIEALFREGKSNTEIQIELRTSYNYVYKITKELKEKEAAKNKEAASE